MVKFGMQQRTERILVETDRYRIVGNITLPRDGYRSRLSDFLNAPDRDFIALTEVSVDPLGGVADTMASVEREFVAVARQHIVFAMPARDLEEAGGGPTGGAA